MYKGASGYIGPLARAFVWSSPKWLTAMKNTTMPPMTHAHTRMAVSSWRGSLWTMSAVKHAVTANIASSILMRVHRPPKLLPAMVSLRDCSFLDDFLLPASFACYYALDRGILNQVAAFAADIVDCIWIIIDHGL